MALYNVGIHYFAGKGTAHSFEKAAQYFQQASDIGFTPAQVTSVYTGLALHWDSLATSWPMWPAGCKG